MKGGNKIQDFWDSTPYEVVRPAPKRGVVYSIAPLGQGEPLRQVHRTDLRSIPEPRAEESVRGVEEMVSREDHTEPQETHKDERVGNVSGVILNDLVEPTHEALDPGVSDSERNLTLSLPSQEDELDVEPNEPRRSSRKTAGQHSNPFNLPRSVLSEVNE